MTTLTRGMKVYRVTDFDAYDSIEIKYKIEEREVVALGRTIKLSGSFLGLHRQIFPLSAFGRSFCATPEEAVAVFADRQNKRIDDHERGIATARSAIEWALAWATNQRKGTGT